MKTAAAYIRVSTEEQTEYSPDSQLKAVRKYAKEHDMILPDEFVFMDEGISGRTAGKRPEFQRMIGTAKLKPKPFDVILLWKFSRFARNRQDSIVYKSMLRKQCGIDVVSVSEQLGEDNTSILIEALIEAMDEYYSLNLAEEVKRGMNEKFSRGGVVSQPPFGYRMGNGHFVPDDNADIVRMIFDDFNSGKKVIAIARKLNGMGITTNRGNQWENRTVEYVLTNPVYIGKLRRSSETSDRTDRFHEDSILVDGTHEPLIEQSVFEEAQARRAGIKKAYSARHARQTPAEFMLRGIVRCDNCGSTLILTGAKPKKYLQCHSYNRGSCNVSHGISLDKLNKIVIDKLTADLKRDTLDIAVSSASIQNTTKHSTAEALIDKERRKLSRVREAYEAGVDTLEEYRENKQKILARIKDLHDSIESTPVQTEQERIASVKGKISASLAVLTAPDLSETAKNETLLSFVEKIIFVKPKGVVEIHYKA